MLSYIHLKNFKSFSNFTLDLRGAHNKPKQTVLIYGENGSGKSNIMLAMLFLTECMNTMENRKMMLELAADDKMSELLTTIKEMNIHELQLSQFFQPLDERIAEYRMLGAQGPMELAFGFRLGDNEGRYVIRFDEGRVIYEELQYLLNKRKGVLFSIADNRVTLSSTTFRDTEYRQVLQDKLERFWGKHTFLAILLDEVRNNNLKYMKARLGAPLFDVMGWMRKLSVCCKGYRIDPRKRSVPLAFLIKLDKGTVKTKDDLELKCCERLLHAFFTQLYSDIKAAYYQITQHNEHCTYELYFKKLIDGRIIDVPLSLESTGTRKIMDILPVLLAAVMGATVVIDEIDSGIHDLLMKNIIDSLAEACVGQLIITTHNTLLLEEFAPENIYILDIDAQGNKAINCVANYDERTQKTHNMRKKYLRGDYAGVPLMSDVDFDELVEDLFEGLKKERDALQPASGEE